MIVDPSVHSTVSIRVFTHMLEEDIGMVGHVDDEAHDPT